MSVTVAPTRHALRCHSCSHGLDYAAMPMRLVGLFRSAAFERVPSTHAAEVRKKCQSCKWINIFHPIMSAPVARRIDIK